MITSNAHLAQPSSHALPGSDTFLADAASKFLNHCRIGKNLAPHTIRAYEGDLHDFATYIGSTAAVQQIERDQIRLYAGSLVDVRKLKPRTVRRRLATLKVLFRWLESEDVVPLSIFHRLNLTIRLPKTLPRALQSSEMKALLRTANRDAAAQHVDEFDAVLNLFAIVVLFTTGVRIGELVALRLGDLSTREGSIDVRGKGNRERRVYLPGDQALKILSRFIIARRAISCDHDALLVDATGRRVTEQQWRQRLRRLARRAGVPRRVTPHMLRHTAATQLLEAGVDIRFVQRLLGHTSIATTQIYTHVSDVALRSRLSRANTLQRLLSG